MPHLPVGITADDLTGAADAAVVFGSVAAPATVSTNGRPRARRGQPAFAVTTDSRARGPHEAYELVSASARAIPRAGACLTYKKVDSNLRGNVGPELAAVRDAIGGPVVFAPAFPARGRTTVEGVALVDGVPVAETEMAVDAEAPVRCSAIEQLIRSQWPDLPVRLCPLADVRAGPAAITGHFREESVLVVDATSDADLDAIADAALSLSPPPVLAGSAGLASAVARRVCGVPERPDWPPEQRGPVLAVLASSSRALTSQVARAAMAPGVRPIPYPCENLSRSDSAMPQLGEAIAAAVEAMAAGRDALVNAVGPLPPVARPVELVVEHLSHLAFVVARRARPRALLVGGGSTAQAVLAALGAYAVDADDQPLPGIAAGVMLGGELGGQPVVLKPGAAGDEDAISALLGYLRQRAAVLEVKQ